MRSSTSLYGEISSGDRLTARNLNKNHIYNL